MKSCKNCDIKYDSPVEYCLLCHNELHEDGTPTEYHFQPYKKSKSSISLLFRIFILINLASIIITSFVNYSLSRKLDWSLIVSVSNIYLIILLWIILYSPKFVIKLLGFIVLTTIEILAIGFLIKDHHWAIDIVLPFSLISSTLLLTIVLLSKKNKWQDYISFLLTSIGFNLLVILLNIFKITQIKWAITASFFYGLLTLIGLIIFSPKEVKEEFMRRFHI
ncbi:DUF6320 domain-containing protein [Haploplasma axanthum]|uniref:Uncharacterized protein n=1 Tax=Haploplasma axanthum TaxID=29552 RepID=A0A449BEK5_HAPAX|nr:DUF6320 domain-containing protein [Haploplasma axanthum]VEU80881.1 Uncharacterised protein [Haploplasma axanthum]